MEQLHENSSEKIETEQTIPSDSIEKNSQNISTNKRLSNLKVTYMLSSMGLKTMSETMISTFVPLFGTTIDASKTQVGFLIAITSLIGITQTLWAKLAGKTRLVRPIALLTSYFSGIIYALFYFVSSVGGFIGLRGLQSVISSGSIPTSSALIAERTQTRDWSFWNSIIQVAITIGSLIGVIVGGIILDFHKNQNTLSEGFGIVFIICGSVSICSAIFLQMAIRPKKKLEKKNRWVQIEEVDVTLANMITEMKTESNFVMLCIAGTIFVLGVNISSPYFIFCTTYFYNFTILQASILSSVSFLSQIISSFLTTKYIEKLSKKRLIIFGGFIVSSFPLAVILPYMLNQSKYVLVLFFIFWLFNGFAWGMVNTSITTIIFDIIHPRRRGLQLGIYNSLIGLSLFTAPIIGGVIFDSKLYHYTFIISAIVRFIGILFFLFVKEPIIGGTILRPIRRLISIPLRYNVERSVNTLIPPISYHQDVDSEQPDEIVLKVIDEHEHGI